MTSAEHWEAEAHRWAAWARAPWHDAYWYYRDAFFALVPPAGRATLEVGFGYARALEAAGFLVESLREPLPGPEAPPTTRGRRLPIFLMLRLLKQPA
jgi:hypothetical protein